MATRVFGKHGFAAYITMNTVEGRALECVMNPAYQRHDAGRQEQAEEAISELNAEYLAAAVIPYRTTISLMNQLVNSKDPFWKTVRDLKDALEPNHIISPGRYNLA